MDLDDDALLNFLNDYADACVQAGVDPLPLDDLAALAEALLAGIVVRAVTRH
jgi:hypothetical protein